MGHEQLFEQQGRLILQGARRRTERRKDARWGRAILDSPSKPVHSDG